MADQIRLNDKAALSHLRDSINTALDALGTELGVKIHAGNCSFESEGDSCRFKLEVERLDAEPQEAKDWKRTAEYLPTGEGFRGGHFVAGDLGRTFISHGKTYAITGTNPKTRKWNVNITNTKTGERKRMESASVWKLLQRQSVAA
jgi:hypothetical protein